MTLIDIELHTDPSLQMNSFFVSLMFIWFYYEAIIRLFQAPPCSLTHTRNLSLSFLHTSSSSIFLSLLHTSSLSNSLLSLPKACFYNLPSHDLLPKTLSSFRPVSTWPAFHVSLSLSLTNHMYLCLSYSLTHIIFTTTVACTYLCSTFNSLNVLFQSALFHDPYVSPLHITHTTHIGTYT